MEKVDSAVNVKEETKEASRRAAIINLWFLRVMVANQLALIDSILEGLGEEKP